MGPIVGHEEELAGGAREPAGERVPASGVDVLDQLRPRSGAVGLPQLVAVRAVVGAEEELTGEGVELREPQGERIPTSWVDELEHRRPCCRAIGPPELCAMGAIVGREIERAGRVGEIGRRGAGASRANVLDEYGAEVRVRPP